MGAKGSPTGVRVAPRPMAKQARMQITNLFCLFNGSKKITSTRIIEATIAVITLDSKPSSKTIAATRAEMGTFCRSLLINMEN